MKQIALFQDDQDSSIEEQAYTSKIETPVYEPSKKCPDIIELIDKAKRNRLINEIEGSNLSQAEKKFLIEASHRHLTYSYEKIADYYAHASPEMQSLMERSALVIIDFEKAIELGYVKLSEQVRDQYLTDYDEE